MHNHATTVGGQQFRQFQYFIQCLLRRIRRRYKVYHFQFDTTAGNHPRGHRRIQTAGQQTHRMTTHANGQTACTGNRGCMDIGELFTDFDINGQIGFVNIHAHTGERSSQLTAHSLTNLNGIQIELLICPFTLHLKGFGIGKLACQIGLGGFHNGFQCLFTGDSSCHGDNTEYLSADFVCRLHIAGFTLRLYINGTLSDIHLKTTVVFHPTADIGNQFVLERAAVQSFQNHLAQF